jgi:lactoylglutathione lyase
MIQSMFYEIYVKSLDVSEKFYGILGLKTFRKQSDFVVMVAEGLKIHLCPIEDCPEYLANVDRSKIAGSRVEFCFVTNQIESLYEAFVLNQIAIHEELQERPWGKMDFRVIDPDGAYLRITTARYFENSCLRNDCLG